MKRFHLIILLTVPCLASAQDILTTREQAVAMIADLRKIHTPEGIEVTEQVELNGEKQWITIRGRNVGNPVLLFVHGGPASPIMPVSWTFQNSWEDYFTVVQWDQRVTGKNWVTADTTRAIANFRLNTIVRDGVALVEHLCKRLNKEKIFILGLSWGTIVGAHVAEAVPEKLFAYIGVGQSYEANDEKYLYARLLVLASKSHNQIALQELKAIAPYPKPDRNTSADQVLVTRKWARYFNGGWYGKQDFKLYFSLPQLAPEYSKEDLKTYFDAIRWGGRKLIHDMEKDVMPLTFMVPVYFIMGRYDLHTPYETSKVYFDKLKAPKKKFFTFERSAHFPMMEEPGRFLVTLVNEILPLAGNVPSYAPDK